MAIVSPLGSEEHLQTDIANLRKTVAGHFVLRTVFYNRKREGDRQTEAVPATHVLQALALELTWNAWTCL